VAAVLSHDEDAVAMHCEVKVLFSTPAGELSGRLWCSRTRRKPQNELGYPLTLPIGIKMLKLTFHPVGAEVADGHATEAARILTAGVFY